MLVMLKGTRNGSFRRSVRDKNGKPIKVLEFGHKVPVELTDPAEIAAIQRDLGVALIEVEPNDRNRFRPVQDTSEATPEDDARKPEDDEAGDNQNEAGDDSTGEPGDNPDSESDQEPEIASNQEEAATALGLTVDEFRALKLAPGFPAINRGYDLTAIREYLADTDDGE